jgi:hypothetical protein
MKSEKGEKETSKRTLGITSDLSASSPPSPVFDFPPRRFMAIARDEWASIEIEPAKGER